MTNEASRWFVPIARAGYVARGAIYLVVGIFAVLAAIDAAQEKSTEGAVITILSQPFGTLIGWLLVIGLAGYVLWRLIQSIMDTDRHGTDIKGLGIRAGLLASAFTYATLGLLALSLLGVPLVSGQSGSESGSGSGGFSQWFAGFVSGQYISLGLAIIFLIVAGAHFYKAATQKYDEHFVANEDEMKLIHPVSMTGLIARGIVFLLLAWLSFYGYRGSSDAAGSSASGQTGSGEKPGTQDVLTFVEGMPYGSILLALLGVGLIAFAVYSFIEARYRRINIEDA